MQLRKNNLYLKSFTLFITWGFYFSREIASIAVLQVFEILTNFAFLVVFWSPGALLIFQTLPWKF